MSEPTTVEKAATDCTCEDVRAMRSCPLHHPRDTTPASDAFVAAWLADLEPYEDHEREDDVKARDIRSLLFRIESDAAALRDRDEQIAGLATAAEKEYALEGPGLMFADEVLAILGRRKEGSRG